MHKRKRNQRRRYFVVFESGAGQTNATVVSRRKLNASEIDRITEDVKEQIGIEKAVVTFYREK